MASSKGTRVFGLVILVACVLVLGGGAWFLFGQQLFRESDEMTSDDEPDEPDELDGGAHHVRHPGKHHGKGRGGHKRANASPVAGGSGPAGKSYEAAIVGAHEQISIGAGGVGAPDLTDAQLAGPMRNATFLGACGTPGSMHVTVKVAIRGGRAVGVSVYTNPPNPQIAGCIDRSVRDLAWPVNGKMDSFVTTY